MSEYIIPMNRPTPWDWSIVQLAKLAMMYDKPGERDDILSRAKATAELYRLEAMYYAALMPIMIMVFVGAEIPGRDPVLQVVPLLIAAWIVYVTIRFVRACRKVQEARYIYATVDQGGFVLEHGCLRGSRPLPNRSAWELFRDYWTMGL
jgi:hypothetical protein